MATAQDRLNQILPSWCDLLTQWSLDGSLVAAAIDALVLESSNAKQDAKGQLQSYVSQWSAGNFQNLPQVVLLSASDISGALGAYADSTDTIYLNQEWLLGATGEEIQKVLTEELGHFLDDQLNQEDTQGDEGKRFSTWLHRSKWNNESNIALTTKPDGISISIEGLIFTAEASLDEDVWLYQSDGQTSSYWEIGPSTPNGDLVLQGLYGLERKQVLDISGSVLDYADLSIDPGYARSIDADGNVLVTGRHGYSVVLGGQYFQGIPFRPNTYFAEYDSNGTYKGSNHASSYSQVEFADASRDYASGDTYVGGSIIGDAYFNGYTVSATPSGTEYQTTDAFYAKLGANGTYEWIRTIGGSGDQLITQLDALDNGRLRAVIYYAGETVLGAEKVINTPDSNYARTFVAYISEDGSIEKALPVAYSSRLAFFEDGSFAYSNEVEIGRHASDGTLLWSHEMPPQAVIYDFDVDQNDGSIVFAGSFKGELTIDGLTIAQSSSGSFLELGSLHNGFIGRFDRDGNLEWLNSVNSPDTALASSVGVTSSGNIYMSGTYYSQLEYSGLMVNSGTDLDQTNPIETSYVLKLYSDGNVAEKEPNIFSGTIYTRSGDFSLNFSSDSPISTREGDELTLTISLNAGLSLRKDLVEGSTIYWKVGGVDVNDISSGAAVGSSRIINGTFTLNYLLADDGIYEEESFEIRFFSDTNLLDPLGEPITVGIVDTTPRYITAAASTDESSVVVFEDLSGPRVQSYTTQPVGKGKNATTIYTWQEVWISPSTQNIDALQIDGGVNGNAITGAGFQDDPSTSVIDPRRPYSAVLVIDGKEGADRITGGTAINWLIGGGTAAGSVDTLIGTSSAKDIFDLRQSTSDGLWVDAYAIGGNAVVNNFDPLKDLLVLSASSYTYSARETPIYKRRQIVGSTISGFDIIDSNNKLIASITGAGFVDKSFDQYVILGQNEKSPFDVILPDGKTIV